MACLKFLEPNLDPNVDLTKFRNPFDRFKDNGDVNVIIENKGWVEQLADKLLGWLDAQKEQFLDWLIPATKNLVLTILDQGITLFQVSIVFFMVFHVYKIIANHQLEEAVSKTYMWGIVFILTVFFKAICLGA